MSRKRNIVAATSSLACGLALVVSSASALTTRTLQARFGPDGTSSTVFETPGSVGVDSSSGSIYVADNSAGTIEKFTAANEPESFTGSSSQIVEGKLTNFAAPVGQIAVGPTHDLYVVGTAGLTAYQADGEPAGFTAGPDAGTNELPGTEACGVTVDGNGDIYESEFSNGIKIFKPDGEELADVPVFGACNLAVDSHGTIYFSQSGNGVQKIEPSEFPVEALTVYSTPTLVDANTATTIAVNAGNDYIVVDEGSQISEFDSTGHRLDTFGGDGSQSLIGSTGLGVSANGSIYAANDEGVARDIDVFGPAIPLPPSIDDVAIKNLTASAVDLTARINPGGLSTNYHFELGTTSNYNTSVPVSNVQIGSSFSDVAVQQHIEGLSPNETYHWRVVATGPGGSAAGTDHTFIYDIASAVLPDNRAYEMVTPAQKNAALIGVVFLGLKPILAEDGSRIIMVAVQCFSGAESCTGTRQIVGEPFMFSRTAAGWITTPLAPPATRFEANTIWLASAETAMGLFSMPTPPGLEDDFYERTSAGEFIDLGPATPPAEGPDLKAFKGGPKAATSDFSHVIFQARAPWASPEAGPELYEIVRREVPTAPIPVGVSGGSGSTSLISQCMTSFNGSPAGAVPGEVSADGSIVYFTATGCPTGTGANAGVEVAANALYARINQGQTVKISERSPTACTTVSCSNSPQEEALFAGAANDGSKAFFISNQQLVDSAGQQGNLYEYDFDNMPGTNLVDVSTDITVGEAPGVQGVVALSPDGSHVYFVATGKLTNRPNQQGQVARSGALNLYMFVRDADHLNGQIAFVAQLPETDAALWDTNDDQSTANVTSEGRYLVFESHGSLTPDDTRTDGASQIFRYDAQTGQLERISRGDQGFNDDGNVGTGDAHIVPSREGGPHNHAGAVRSDPTMSDDGAYIFFESPIGLVPHAVDDVQIGTLNGSAVYAENIYEWHDGRIALISDGKDTKELANESAVKLIGSDITGSNVFFRTADALLPQDTDTQIDYYDARICTAQSPCASTSAPSEVPCLGEACHGVQSIAPPVPMGGSATLVSGLHLPLAGQAKKKSRKRQLRVKCKVKHERAVGAKCKKAGRTKSRAGKGRR